MNCPHGIPIDAGPPCGACVRGEPPDGPEAVIARLIRRCHEFELCEHVRTKMIVTDQRRICLVCGAYQTGEETLWRRVEIVRALLRDAAPLMGKEK